MENFYSQTGASGAMGTQGSSFQPEYILGNPGVQEAVYSNVGSEEEVPFEYTSLINEAYHIQPNNTQPPQRAREILSSRTNAYGDFRNNLYKSSTWFPYEIPSIPDSVPDIKYVQNDIFEHSKPQYFQEHGVMPTENSTATDVSSVYGGIDLNLQGFSTIQENNFNNVIDPERVLNEDPLLKNDPFLNDPNFTLDSLLNDDFLGDQLDVLTDPSLHHNLEDVLVIKDYCDPLPVLEEGISTTLPKLENGLNLDLIQFLNFGNAPRSEVFVEATAPQLQPQAPEPQIQVAPKRGRGRPRKDATNQNATVQKKPTESPFNAKPQFSLMPYGLPERKSKLKCQENLRTSMSEEDTNDSSADQDYIPDPSDESTSKKIRRVSNSVQDGECSSTSENNVTGDRDRRKKNNEASKKSRDKKKEKIQSYEKLCEKLEKKNRYLRGKAAELKTAYDYVMACLNSAKLQPVSDNGLISSSVDSVLKDLSIN